MIRSDVFHRNPNVTPPLARAGRNHFIIASETDSHSPIVDLSCGAAVTGLGHSCLPVKDAIITQIRNLAYCHSAQFTHSSIESAATLILEACEVDYTDGVRASWNPFAKGAVTFFSGGAEAVEAAVKIGLQVLNYLEIGAPPSTIVGRGHSYHGNSVFTLALGDHPRKLNLYAGFNITPRVERIAPFAPSMFGAPLNTDEVRAHTAVALRSLEIVLRTQAESRRRCVVVIETVGGTTIGIEPPSVEYLIGVRRLCSEYGAILIYDEILCANYRTGQLTAWQYYQARASADLAPDIFVMGKGITAGYFPMSAVVVSKMVREVGEGDGKVWHTSTNQNHVVGCAAACAALEEYGYIATRVDQLGQYIDKVIRPAICESNSIMGMTGVGMLWGVRFEPDQIGLHLQIKKRLLTKGYSVYSDGGTIAGTGNMIMFAPPYVMDEIQLDAAANAIIWAAQSSDI